MVDRFSDYRNGENCDLKPHSALRTVQDFVERLGHGLDEFYVFTTVRNPWDRAVSIYHYGLKNDKSAWHRPATEAGSFKKFLESDMMARHFRMRAGLRPLAEGTYDIDTFCADRNGAVVAHVFMVEEIEKLPRALRSEVGIECELVHVNRTEHRGYREYYDDESRDLVQYLFERDIRRFGYAF